MLAVEALLCEHDLSFFDKYNNLVNEKYFKPKSREFLKFDFTCPVFPESQNSAEIRPLKMSAQFNDVENELIQQEIKKLKENSKIEISDLASSSSSYPPQFSKCTTYYYDNSGYIKSETNSPVKSYKKLPTNLFIKSVIENFSPRQSKKFKKKELQVPVSSTNPVLPHCMFTYSRGVSIYHSHSMVRPSEPSLVALRVQSRLEDARKIRKGLESEKFTINCKPHNFSKENHPAKSKVLNAMTANKNIVDGKTHTRRKPLQQSGNNCNLISPQALNNSHEFQNYCQSNCQNSNSKMLNFSGESYSSVNFNTSNARNSSNVFESSRQVHYYGQSPFDDDFDPSIHKPNINKCSSVFSPSTVYVRNLPNSDSDFVLPNLQSFDSSKPKKVSWNAIRRNSLTSTRMHQNNGYV